MDDAAAAQVNMDSLKFFCDADTKVMGFQTQVNALLAAGDDSAEDRGEEHSGGEHRALMRAKIALDGALPAVQNLGNLLRKKGGNLCPSPGR